MNKVRITADAVLTIVRSIFKDEDINTVTEDIEKSAPEEWRGKTVSEILNVEYYTFKHRPSSASETIYNLIKEQRRENELSELTCAFGLLSIDSIERLYSKDVDMVALGASLRYYIQSSKVKLLEYLIEDCNIATSGLRIPVRFGSEARRAVVFFGRPIVSDVQTAAPFGEMVNVDIDVSLMLYPDVASYGDYTVNIGFTDNGVETNADVPLSSFSVASIMTQNAVPAIDAQRDVSSINLSRALSFVLVFEGYDNKFIEYITKKALTPNSVDNNESFTLTISRGGDTYTHTVVVKDHQITVNADTGNETHTLSFVKRGFIDGNT